ncbi:MAG TPA: MaoC/PaaZ C-terminal domain-containing protein [Polyangiaceae bacterium]|nr:MaoC/PaaZ C-terminal domain-containing protein [Polyangiaceae bacterium]
MTLDLSAVGYETAPFSFEYDFKTTILYALGIGCSENDLDYLYEGRGPKVMPSFAVVPSYPALAPLVERAGADMTKVVHGAQSITLHAAIPAQGTLHTVARIDGIYDFKRLSQVVFSTKSFLSDQLLFETEWMLVVRDTGGFGGPRPPKGSVVKVPADVAPSFETSQEIGRSQALLYRLSGDLNPLHADPEFARAVGFEQGPILHGLCTFGYVTRALIEGPCAGAPERLKHLSVQFKKPVWPGESLRTMSYWVDDGQLALNAYANDRPEAVVGGSARVTRS